mgnify:CR=1 FL=1
MIFARTGRLSPRVKNDRGRGSLQPVVHLQQLDDAEEISVKAWEIDELLKMIYEGTLQDSKTVAAITAYLVKKNKKYIP